VEQLSISSAAISQNIKELERILSTKLFGVSKSGMMPTGEATELYNSIKPAFNSIFGAEQSVGNFTKESSGTIKLRCPPHATPKLLRCMHKFIKEYPNIEFEVIIDLAYHEYAEYLKAGKVDLLITFTPITNTVYDVIKLADFNNVFFATEKFLSDNNIGKTLTLSQLRSQTVIASGKMLGIGKFSALKDLRPTINTQSFELVYNAVLENVGIGFVNEGYLMTRDSHVTKIKISDVKIPKASLLCYYNKILLSKPAQIFLKALIDAL